MNLIDCGCHVGQTVEASASFALLLCVYVLQFHVLHVRVPCVSVPWFHVLRVRTPCVFVLQPHVLHAPSPHAGAPFVSMVASYCEDEEASPCESMVASRFFPLVEGEVQVAMAWSGVADAGDGVLAEVSVGEGATLGLSR